jgi:hypothetical protein
MADLSTLKAEVQRLLVDDLQLNAVKLTRSGFSFRMESTEVFVDVIQRERKDGNLGDTIVAIYAPVALQVPITDELCRYVALNADSYVFGHLSLAEDPENPGHGYVSFTHHLLGDHMDPPEFKTALGAVAGTAEDLDDQVTSQFGGHRAYED